MLLVLYQNDLYDLDMPYLLFESFKSNRSLDEVELIQHNNSTYKRKVTAPLSEVEDYSKARNQQALQSN